MDRSQLLDLLITHIVTRSMAFWEIFSTSKAKPVILSVSAWVLENDANSFRKVVVIAIRGQIPSNEILYLTSSDRTLCTLEHLTKEKAKVTRVCCTV